MRKKKGSSTPRTSHAPIGTSLKARASTSSSAPPAVGQPPSSPHEALSSGCDPPAASATEPHQKHGPEQLRTGNRVGHQNLSTQPEHAHPASEFTSSPTHDCLGRTPGGPRMKSLIGYEMKTARPYRSHKYPACTRCHKRRSRCTIEIPGQACLLCRMHGVPCSSATAKTDERVSPRVGFIHRSMIPENDSMDDSSYIVGPIVARDTQIMDQYLPNANGPNGHVSIQPNWGRKDSQNPIYRALVPPRRPSPQDCHCSRNLPAELLEQVDPFLDKLISAFYENIHPAFPITEEHFVVGKLKDKNALPQTFLVNLVAHSLFYWDLSPSLANFARPNQDFAWQVAVSANVTDIQKSDLSNVLAVTVNIAGRPSTCVVNNTTNVARIVALAHAIGLNHDCSEWKMPEQERRARWKAWWGVVTHDRWFNFASGTPPYVSKGHYDVPLPTVELLTAGRGNSVKHVRAAEVYIHLCRLTEIVGDVLPLIYHIRSGNDSLAAEQTSRSEIELNRWVESRPSWLSVNEFQNRPAIPGLVNLQLCYLSVRMLLRRIAWHEISQRESDPASSWLLGCQAAAEDIVRLVSSLQKQDLRSFWLPYSAHHFTSAVTLLLRCALQTTYREVRKQCMTSARTLVDTLRKHYDEESWDLAETALASSENILRRIEDAIPRTPIMRTSNIMPVMSNSRMDRGYVNEHFVGDLGTQEDEFMSYQGQASIEELFPGIFSDFTDIALFTGPNTDDFHE